jgi:hypothetical protein
MPDGLRSSLSLLGHTVDSVASLQLKGLENNRLYREVARGSDLLFTKDREFAAWVRRQDPVSVKVILTTISQQPEPAFIAAFMAAFRETEWADVEGGSEWPVAR